MDDINGHIQIWIYLLVFYFEMLVRNRILSYFFNLIIIDGHIIIEN